MSQSSRQYLEYQEDEYYQDLMTGEVVPYGYAPIQQPSAITMVWRSLRAKLSNIRLKDNTAYAAHLQEQADIEAAATFIEKQIVACNSLRYLESLQRMVANLPIVHPTEKVQVNAWVDSLNMQICLKYNQLAKK